MSDQGAVGKGHLSNAFGVCLVFSFLILFVIKCHVLAAGASILGGRFEAEGGYGGVGKARHGV